MAPKKNDKKVLPKKQGGYPDDESEHDPEATSSNAFDPSNSEVSPDEVAKLFKALSLSDQLEIAKKFEEHITMVKEKMKGIKSTKQVQNKIDNQNKKSDPSTKKESDDVKADKRRWIALVIIHEGNRFVINVKRNNRVGTVRQMVVHQLNWKKNAAIKMLRNGQPLSDNASQWTFLYTLGFEHNDEVTVELLTDTVVENNDDNDMIEGSEVDEETDGEEQS